LTALNALSVACANVSSAAASAAASAAHTAAACAVTFGIWIALPPAVSIRVAPAARTIDSISSLFTSLP
jgi:hypothetical protein